VISFPADILVGIVFSRNSTAKPESGNRLASPPPQAQRARDVSARKMDLIDADRFTR
jgi:hypothetical protein